MAKANKLIPVVDGTAGTPIELTDSRIEITNPAANDLLQYDSTQQQFVNTPASSVVPSHRTINHEQITDSSLGDINLHDGFYFPNAVQDYDGNWYGAVVIGDKVWLGSNLRTKHLADGTAINSGGQSGTALNYYDYATHPLPVEKRGLLYSFPVAASTIIINWTTPTSNDFSALNTYLNNQTRYSSAVKAMAATDGWGTSSVNNAIGNNLLLNNGSGLSLYPTGKYNSSASSAGDCVLWTINGTSTKTCPYLVPDDITYGTRSYNYSSWSLAIRLVSTLTPVQFRDWYVNTYGTLQHNVLSSELSAGKDIAITPQSQYVPEGFEELEYISSTGTQWLNTYVVLGYNNTVSIKIVAQGTGDRGLICGFDQDWAGAYLGDNGSKYYMIGLWHTDERNTSNSLLKTTLSSTWTSTSSQYTQSGSIDDVSNTVYTSSRLNNINLEFLLFRSNAWETADSYWAGRIFECKIWKNGKLVRNFVPARRISGNVVGLYETVNKEFYSNKGTGVFNAGPTVAIGAKTTISYTGIEIPNLTNNSGKVLAVNSGETGVEWVTQSGGGGSASQLNDLSDVTISSAASGQALLHNGTNWVNGALPKEVLVCSYDTSNNTMDKTPAEIVAAKAANKIVICKLSYPTTDFLFLNQANSDPFVVFTGFSQTTSSTSVLTAKYHVLRYTTTDSWKFFTFNIQQQLVSGTNIKTINGNSLLGSGDLVIGGVTIYSGSTAPSLSTGSNGDIYIQTVS